MLKEYFKLKKYVKIRFKFILAGLFFLFLGIITNSISFTAIIPLMDIVLSGKKIKLPENLPVSIGNKIEPVISKLNTYPPLLVLKYLILFVILTFFLKGLFYYLNNYFFKFFSARTLADIRNKLYKKILNLPLDFYSSTQTGEITTRIIYDVGILSSAIESFFPNFLFPIFLAFNYFLIAFIIDWKLSLISIIIFPLIFIPISQLSKKLRQLGKAIQETYGKVANFINETAFGQKIIKAYNLEEKMIKRFEKSNEEIFRTVISTNARVLLISPFIDFSIAIGSCFIVYYAGNKIITGSISPGFLSLFLFSLFSTVSPLKEAMQTYAILKHSSSALPRIFSIFDLEAKIKDEGEEIFTGLKEKIEFKNVSFAYNNSTLILKNINITVKKGEKIGIVGKIGSGKSTLVGLLLRFYDTNSGKIEIDGKNIKVFKIETLRNHIGYVPQEPIIFYGTIKENITLGDENDERFREIIKLVGLDNFIEELPEKENTIIGERGVNLSGGQKQLISIARAIYKDPEILIFDEATASLDGESERIVQSAIEKIMKGRTVFIVAHRLSTIKNATKIVVLENGEIVEEGTHEELYEKKGIYYKFFCMQKI
ncbi:MAG: ABC transporter ATP-binding protein/permease [Candidatus Omnitrophica bacterium]|nr:ABC transporter ATP-binding protein/permease [Candidatus Omnitrophota bacterium]